MHIIKTLAELNCWQPANDVAMVPTMGALHAGHEALIKAATDYADNVIVSVFVNPTQFGPNEDYSRYPRTAENDIKTCERAGAAAVFMPTVDEIYPAGFATSIRVSGLTETLCGAHRPGHFDGVATVVARLLLLVRPDVALFGEKDYQQLQVIKRMVADLAIRTDIVGFPVFREADGLAFSSRNAYLSADERKAAPAIFAELNKAAAAIRGGDNVAVTLAAAKNSLIKAGFDAVDYFSLCDGASLIELNEKQQNARLLTAARLGKTRLIDNIAI